MSYSSCSISSIVWLPFFYFFFNDTATTEIYTLSLHDALPISAPARGWRDRDLRPQLVQPCGDRKSTRLNSSHVRSSYAVFCLKKKNKTLPASQQTQKRKEILDSCVHHNRA